MQPNSRVGYNITQHAITVASNLGFPFRILSRSFGFSPKLWDKIQNGKPGFEATVWHGKALSMVQYSIV